MTHSNGGHALLRFEKIVAAFHPMRTDNLKPGLRQWIGYSCEWIAMWTVESGAYKGQWAMTMVDVGVTRNGEHWPCHWVPLCDLVVPLQ